MAESLPPIRKKRAVSTALTPVNETGKIPPQAVDLEEAVLGALMIEKNAVNEVIDILKPESFYKDNHQLIFVFGHYTHVNCEYLLPPNLYLVPFLICYLKKDPTIIEVKL